MLQDFLNFKKQVKRELAILKGIPTYPWITTATSSFLSIPNLRGFWPMSSVDENNLVYDLSGQDRHLTDGGSTAIGASTDGLFGLAYFDGTNDYLTRNDEAGLDITGSMSLGGWFYPSADSIEPADNFGLIGKWLSTGDQRSYLIDIPSGTATPRFRVSSGGTGGTVYTVTSSTSMVANRWYHIFASFDANDDICIFVNGVKDINTTSIPASIHSGSANFNIGAINNGAASNRYEGYASHCFLCENKMTDDAARTQYEISRGMFGA